MSMGIATLITEEEFLKLQDFEGRQELMDGELIELPGAKYSHNGMSMHFVDVFRTVVDGFRVCMEQTYRLRPGRWLIPDVSVTWPDQRIEDDCPQGAPMLAVE